MLFLLYFLSLFLIVYSFFCVLNDFKDYRICNNYEIKMLKFRVKELEKKYKVNDENIQNLYYDRNLLFDNIHDLKEGVK